jgi:hypothetical protein
VVDGAADGMALGVADGVVDGAADGVALGVADGVIDGAADGVALGMADGVVDGAADGMALGAADGVVDGAADGMAVGAALGASVVGGGDEDSRGGDGGGGDGAGITSTVHTNLPALNLLPISADSPAAIFCRKGTSTGVLTLAQGLPKSLVRTPDPVCVTTMLLPTAGSRISPSLSMM